MVNTQEELLQAELTALKQHIQTLETQLVTQEQAALRFRALFEQSNDAIFLLDLDGVHFACNHRAADMLGYESPAEIIGLSFRDVVHVDSQSDSETKLQRMLEGGKIPPYERMFCTRGGDPLPVEVNVEIIRDQDGNALYIQSIVRDISERKQVERTLRASEQRYRQMFERNEAVKLLINPDTGALVDVNPAAVRFYGYDRDTLRRMKITDINMLPADQVADEMKHARQQERNFFRFKHRLASGDIRDVEVTSCPINAEEGVLLYSIITDVTDRNSALYLLQASELRYRQLFEDVPVALWEEDYSGVKAIVDRLRDEGVIDFDAYFDAHPDALEDCAHNVVILNVNRAALDMFGEGDKQAVIGKTLYDTMGEVGYTAFKIELLDIISGEHTTQIETPISTASIQQGHASLGWTIAPGSEHTWDRILVSLTDITDLQMAQDALRQSETRYRGLFEHVPVALWEEDFSGAKAILEDLKTEGIADFDSYFDAHPDVLEDCARQVRVLDVNQAALALFGVPDKPAVVGTTLFDTMSDDGYDPFKQELIALLNNEMTMRLETTVRTVNDERGYASLGWSIAPGSEDTWDRVLVSITDITAVKQAQDAMRESETRYRGLFEHVPIGLWEEDFSGAKAIIDDLKARGVTDLDAYFDANPEVIKDCARAITIVDVNEAALRQYQTEDRAVVVGMQLIETLPEEALDRFKYELVALANQQDYVRLELPIGTSSGEVGYGRLELSIAPGSKDTWERVLVSITDITDLKRTQDAVSESEARYRMLFNIAPVVLLIEDFSYVKTQLDNLTAQGMDNLRAYLQSHPEFVRDCAANVTVTEANERAAEMYGAQHPTELERPLSEVFVDVNYETFSNELLSLAAGEYDYQFESILRRFDDELREIWLRRVVLPGAEDDWSRVLILIIDITDRKAREQHRIELGVERERVGMLQQFISGASHDIRTPLATMTTSLYLLEHGGDDPQRRQRHVQTLEQQVKALNRIIDDMLVMSRMDDSSQMEFGSIHVESVIRAILDQYHADIEAKGHTIHSDIAPNLAPIRAADSYVHRALGSVITNAIEYTPDNGSIRIRVSEQDQHIVIEVQDDGIGIAPDILPHIFDPFYRGDKARQAGHGHTGMGLTLARKVINLHNGTIDVQSEPEVGSTVKIRLPTVPLILR